MPNPWSGWLVPAGALWKARTCPPPASADHVVQRHLPQGIQRLAADFLHDYIFLTVGRVGSSTDLIAQHVEYVQQDQKRETVLDCVNTVEGSALVGDSFAWAGGRGR